MAQNSFNTLKTLSLERMALKHIMWQQCYGTNIWNTHYFQPRCGHGCDVINYLGNGRAQQKHLYFEFCCLYVKNELGDPHPPPSLFLMAEKWSRWKEAKMKLSAKFKKITELRWLLIRCTKFFYTLQKVSSCPSNYFSKIKKWGDQVCFWDISS